MFVSTKVINTVQKKRLLLNVFILAILLAQPALAQSAHNKPGKLITLDAAKTTLYEVISSLKAQSDYDFFYDKEAARKVSVQNLRIVNASLPEVLQKMRKELPVDYQVLRNEVSIRIESPEQHNRRKQQEQPGKITGKIIDDKGEALPGASVKIKELNRGIQSSVDGTYLINVPPGTYTVEVSYVSYQNKRVTDVTVLAGKITPLDILLKTDSKSLNEVVVTSSYRRASIEGLYARQKNSAGVTDGITAEQISRTPDNNTAQVLKRVSGLQVSDGKYVVVRGLSDRYNNVLLNGSMLPSSEPNKRNFSFDMVPSAMLDRIVVSKTATPDQTGEFTGGLIQIETKDIPTENFFHITIGTGYNTQSTGKDMTGLDRGKNAWIGFTSDIHKKPEGMTFGGYTALEGKVNRLTTQADDPNRQKIHQFLRTMPYNWTLKKYTAMPTQNYQLQLGRTIPFKNESKLGIVTALTYRNEQDIEDRSLYMINSNDFTGTNNKFATTLGGSLNLGYQFGKHKITLQNTYNHKFSDDMWKYTGVDGDNNNIRHDSYTNVTIVNQLFQSQLAGEHTLGRQNIRIDWLASAGWVDRDQPYSRQLGRLNGNQSDNDPSDYLGLDLTDNNLKNGNLFYSELKEKVYNWATNVQVPFRVKNLSQTFKVGYSGKYRDAGYEANLFRMYQFNDASYPRGTPYDQILTQENFGKDLYLHAISGNGRDRENSSSAEGYDGFQRLNAFYAMLDLKPLRQLRLTGGIRAEKNSQNVYDYLWNVQEQIPERKLTTNSQTTWLPSVNAVYSITDKLNLRSAWYKTVARPDLRELSSFTYWDYDLFASVSGSPLQTTNVENADLRLEYYPAPGEVFSVSAFYKKFRNPIEMIIDGAASSFIYRYSNLESALDKGMEVDFRKSLNFLGSSSGFFNTLFLSGNFTWIDANVTFLPSTAVDEDGNPIDPKRDRPLTGQSPYIINGGLQYAGKAFGLNVSYNRFGKRIVFASPDRSTDEYENSRDMLDLQLSYKLLKQGRAEIKLNISDLLNQQQFFYRNQFSLDNPFGFPGGQSSVDRYPGSNTEQLKPEEKDPKGTAYNKDYDTVSRRYKFGTTYTLNFTYRF